MAQKIVSRTGLASEIPTTFPLLIGEIGYDTDMLVYRVGDGTTTPPRGIMDKSFGAFSYPNVDYVEYPEVRVIGTGTVDGVDVSELNSASGILTRVSDNSWAHRTMISTDGNIAFNNADGVAGNPDFNLSAAFLATIPFAALLQVEHDTSLFGLGTAGTPLGVVQATTTLLGGIRISTAAEVVAGTSTTTALTPASLLSLTAASPVVTHLNTIVGSTTHEGSGAPTVGIGATGDMYVNTDNADIYGPKTAVGWPTTYNRGASATNFAQEDDPITVAGGSNVVDLGDTWYRLSDGTLALRINDGTSDLWMQVNSAGIVDAHTTSDTEPTDPKVGDTWYQPSTDNFAQRVNDGNSDLWMQLNMAGGGGSTSTYTAFNTETTPTTMVLGDTWYKPSTDNLAMYVNDGNSSFWMQINGGASSSSVPDLSTLGELDIGSTIIASVFTAGTGASAASIDTATTRQRGDTIIAGTTFDLGSQRMGSGSLPYDVVTSGTWMLMGATSGPAGMWRRIA